MSKDNCFSMCQRILTGKDRVDPATWGRLQGDQVREGATSTWGHRGYQALLPKPPARLELRRELYSHRVVENYNKLPDRVKMADSMNMFKTRLDEYLIIAWPIVPVTRMIMINTTTTANAACIPATCRDKVGR